MNLEPVIQSEVGQKEKKKMLSIKAYMWNLEKLCRWTYCQGKNRDTDIGTDMWTWGWDREGEEGGTHWEIIVGI